MMIVSKGNMRFRLPVRNVIVVLIGFVLLHHFEMEMRQIDEHKYLEK